MQNGVNFSLSRGVLSAQLFGEIDHHSARIYREGIDSELYVVRPSTLVLDFSDIGFMDSSGIALIIGRHEICLSLGVAMRLVGLSDAQKKIVRLSGIERLKNVSIESK